MSLTKILDSDITTNGVQSAPDKLTGTAAQNKAVFDNLIAADTASVKKRFNDLIDALEATTGTTGAGQIGAAVTGITGSDTQTILTALKTLIDTLDGDAVKVVSQSLTEAQKTQARNNIGVSGTAVAVNSVNGKTGAVVLYKDITGTLAEGQTSVTLSDSSIATTSTYEIYTDAYGVAPKEVNVTSGSITLTFKAQSADLGVKVRIY